MLFLPQHAGLFDYSVQFTTFMKFCCFLTGNTILMLFDHFKLAFITFLYLINGTILFFS